MLLPLQFAGSERYNVSQVQRMYISKMSPAKKQALNAEHTRQRIKLHVA